MKNIKLILLGVVACTAFSCHTPPKHVPKADTVPVTNKESATQKGTPVASEQHAEMEFVNYNDDGDYYHLIAQKADSTYNFINNDDEDRSLNRGDLIAITWARGTITLAGDGDAPEEVDIIKTVKKISDGPVSKFRKVYGKKISYISAPDENYSQYYKDKLYLLVEYYLANTRSSLLQLHINKKDDLSYSLEQQTKNNKEYTMIGIATTSENSRNTMQWLYFDSDKETLYEYDLPNDKLIELH